jgi:hypothetical protein
MIYIFQIYCLLLTAVSAYRDGIEYLLRGKSIGTYFIIKKRNNYWHISGATEYAIAVMFIFVINIYFKKIIPVDYLLWGKMVLGAVLIRLFLFDCLRNKVSQSRQEFGTEAFWDKIFTGVFGKKGVVIKSLFFFILLLVLNLLNYYL